MSTQVVTLAPELDRVLNVEACWGTTRTAYAPVFWLWDHFLGEVALLVNWAWVKHYDRERYDLGCSCCDDEDGCHEVVASIRASQVEAIAPTREMFAQMRERMERLLSPAEYAAFAYWNRTWTPEDVQATHTTRP